MIKSMNKNFKLKILYILILIFVFLIVPSAHKINALKCDRFSNGIISLDANPIPVSSLTIMNVSGKITGGECSVNCVYNIPLGGDGQMAVSDPIELLSYNIDNSNWIDLIRGTTANSETVDWYLLDDAAPLYCVAETSFYNAFLPYVYNIATTFLKTSHIDISNVSYGSGHTLYLKAKYETGREWTQEFNFTKPSPSINLKVRQSGVGNYVEGPITVPYGSAVDLNWTSTYMTGCTVSGGWTGTRPVNGTETTGNLTSSKTYTIDCTPQDNKDWPADSVVVNVGPPPTPTVSCSVGADPSSGMTPLNDVDLTTQVSGTATGNIVYKLDCTNDGTYEHTSSAISTNPYTRADLCDYPTAGTYTVKAEVTREGVTNSCTNTVVVSDATVSCALVADPSAGTAPLTDVSFTTSVGGTATGNIVYKLDCTNDGTYEHTSSAISTNPYTKTNACNYITAGTYTAKAEVTRSGATATCTTQISVSLAVNNLSTFKTPLHPYPGTDFTYLPKLPNLSEKIDLTDNSTCYDESISGSDCSIDKGDIFQWTMVGATPDSAITENIIIKYLTLGLKTIILRVTDSVGYSCTETKQVRVNYPLPTWREIKPF